MSFKTRNTISPCHLDKCPPIPPPKTQLVKVTCKNEMTDFTSICKFPNILVKTQICNTSPPRTVFGIKPINMHTLLWQPLQRTT